MPEDIQHEMAFPKGRAFKQILMSPISFQEFLRNPTFVPRQSLSYSLKSKGM
jgi:hypothetical protein